MRSFRRTAAGLAALSTVMACVASAGAYTVTLGPTEIPSTPTGEGFVCFTFCEMPFTVAQRASSYVNAAPSSGVITSWRISAEKGPLQLRVLEPSAGGGWVGAGTSALATNLAGGPNATAIPIDQGDLIGVDLGKGASMSARFKVPVSEEILYWHTAVEEGGSGQTGESQGRNLLLFSAAVELAPIVTSVSPASGSTAGGGTVTITGKYLDSAVNVVFGSRPASTFSIDPTGEHITATTPASTPGTVDVQVSSLHSTSEPVAADAYTFLAPSAAGPGSSPGGGGGGGAGQAGGPLVSGFSQSAARWRLGGALARISSTPVGTTFTFRLDRQASVALTFTRVLPGRRAGRKCVPVTHANRNQPRCKRHVTLGSLPVPGHAGLNTVRFQGRLSRSSRLKPGSYNAGITTRDSHGLRTLTRPLSFTIVP